MFPIVNTTTTDLRAALGKSEIQETQKGSGKAFLRFDYLTGDFLFGKEKEEITDEQIVVNVATFTHGWTLWESNTVKKVSVPFTQPIPDPIPPNSKGEPSSESRGFCAQFLDDEDKTTIVFEGSSFGIRKGCDRLLSEVRAKAAVSEFCFPVVKLTSENYKADKGKIIYNPVFEVVSWMNQDGEMEAEQVKKLESPSEAEPVRRRRV